MNKSQKALTATFSFFMFIIGALAIGTFIFRDDLSDVSVADPLANFVPHDFKYGIFEDGNVTTTYGTDAEDDQAFREMIRNIKGRNMNSIMFANKTPNLAVSDQEGGVDIITGPSILSNYVKGGDPATLNAARSKLNPIIDQFKNFNSLLGYSLIDDATPEYADKLKVTGEVIKERDPSSYYSPVYVRNSHQLLLDTDPNAIIYYFYPARLGNDTCEFGDLNNDWVGHYRNIAQLKKPEQPFWTILQTHKHQQLKEPTVEETRLQFWLSIGEDVDGIYWFVWSEVNPEPWTGLKNNGPLLAEVTDLGQRLENFEELMENSTKVGDRFYANISGGKAYASTLYEPNTGKYYVVAANHECSSKNVSITSPYFNGQLKNIENNQTINIGSTINLRGGDGVIFEVVNPTQKSGRESSNTIQENIVPNGSFENGSSFADGWRNRSEISIDSSNAKEGSKSLKINGSSSTNFNYTFPENMQNLKPDTEYYISYWLKGQNLNGATAAMRYTKTNSPSVTLFNTNWDLDGSFDWKKYIAQFKTTDDHQTGRLDITWQLNSNSTAWIDDITLCEVGKPCRDSYRNEFTPDNIVVNPTSTTTTTTGNDDISDGSDDSGGTTGETGNGEFKKVPYTTANYGSQTAEQYWASHPYNPDTNANNYIPVGAIESDGPIIDVCSKRSGSNTAGIRESIQALPDSGGTLYFDPNCGGNGVYDMSAPLSWHKVQYPQDYNWVAGGMQLNVMGQNRGVSGSTVVQPGNIHFVSNGNGATIRGSMHFAGNGGNTASTFSPESMQNLYFKNLTFERGHNKRLFFIFEETENILFDNVTFNQVGFLSVSWGDNVFIRDSELIGGPGFFFDGNHTSGVINSKIDKVGANDLYSYKTAFDFHVNNDAIGILGSDGQPLSEDEIRRNRYMIFDKNEIIGKANDVNMFTGGGADILIKNNKLSGTFNYFYNMDPDTRKITNTDRYHEYFRFYVDNNTGGNHNYFVRIGEPREWTSGNYFIRNNRINSVTRNFFGFNKDNPSFLQPNEHCGNNDGNKDVDSACTNNPPAYDGAVTSFSLINADNDSVIRTINTGDTIDLKSLPSKNLNIRINTSGSIGSVKVGFNGNNNYNLESSAPYSLKNESGGNYQAVPDLKVGSFNLTATPYQNSNASGEVGQAKSISFSIVDTTQVACDGDYNQSGTVDLPDFAIFVTNYKRSGISCNLDLAKGDCYLDIFDFSVFASVYKTPGRCE